MISGFSKEVSTAKKITILMSYFPKITDLHAILSCNLGAFCWPLFLTHISGGFLRETACKCQWLPAIVITSENYGVLSPGLAITGSPLYLSPFPDLLHKFRPIFFQFVFPNTGNQRKILTINGPGAGHLMKTFIREDDIRWHTVPVCDCLPEEFQAQE